MGSERVCMFAVVFLIAGTVGDRLLHHALAKRLLHQDISVHSNVTDLLHPSEDSRIMEHLHETHPEHLDIEAHKEQFELLNKNLDSLKDNLAVLRGRIDLLQNYLTLHINKTESETPSSNDTTSAVTDKIKINGQNTLASRASSSTLSQENVEPINATPESTTRLTSTHQNLSVLDQYIINESLSPEKNVSKRKMDAAKSLFILTRKVKRAGSKPLRESSFNSSTSEAYEAQANKSTGINETFSLKFIDPETLWSSFVTIIDSVAALKRMMDDNIWNHNRGVLHVLRGHPFVGDGQELQNMDPVSGRELCNELLRKLDSMIASDSRNGEDNDNYEHEAARMLVDSFVRVLDATFALKTIMDSRAQKRGVGIPAVTPTGDTIMSVNEEIISTQSSQEHSTATSIKGQFTSGPLLNKQANLSSDFAYSTTEAGTNTSSPETPTSKNDMPKSTTVRKNAKGASVNKPHTNISDLGDKEISTEKLLTSSSIAHQNKSAVTKEAPRTTEETDKTNERIHHEISPTGTESKIKQNVTKEDVSASTTAPVEHEATHKQSTVHHRVQDKTASTALSKATEHQGTNRSTPTISMNGTVLYSALNVNQNEEKKDNSQTTSNPPNSSEASNLTTHVLKDSLENITTLDELNINSTDESTVNKVKRALNATNSSQRRVRIDRSPSTDNESLKMKSFVDSLETLLEDILDTHNLKRDVSNMLGLNEYSDEPMSFSLSLDNNTTEGVVTDVVEITEATTVKDESSSEAKNETSVISTQNLGNITLIANHSTPDILETASTHHDKVEAPGNHSLSISSTTTPDQDAQETKSELNTTNVTGSNEHLGHKKSGLHFEQNHSKSFPANPLAFLDLIDDDKNTVEHDSRVGKENVSEIVLPQLAKGSRVKSNIHGEFQTLDDSTDDEHRQAVYKPEKTNLAEDMDERDDVYGAGVNSAYVATVTVPSFLGMLVFSLLCCFCLRNSSWCCRLFKEQPASHVYLVEEHSTD